MARKKRTPEELSIDPAAQQMLSRADELGLGTAFHRADAMAPCNIGSAGMCCKLCGMGPCRLTNEGQTGICGATIDTVQARNFIRAIAAGSAAHSDHGRDMAFTLKAVANGEAEGYTIRDVAKLRSVAAEYDIPIEDRAPDEDRARAGGHLLPQGGLVQRGAEVAGFQQVELVLLDSVMVDTGLDAVDGMDRDVGLHRVQPAGRGRGPVRILAGARGDPLGCPQQLRKLRLGNGLVAVVAYAASCSNRLPQRPPALGGRLVERNRFRLLELLVEGRPADGARRLDGFSVAVVLRQPLKSVAGAFRFGHGESLCWVFADRTPDEERARAGGYLAAVNPSQNSPTISPAARVHNAR